MESGESSLEAEKKALDRIRQNQFIRQREIYKEAIPNEVTRSFERVEQEEVPSTETPPHQNANTEYNNEETILVLQSDSTLPKDIVDQTTVEVMFHSNDDFTHPTASSGKKSIAGDERSKVTEKRNINLPSTSEPINVQINQDITLSE